MKTLILMRHAKSSWANANLPDYDRPLNDRGRHGAQAIGQWLADQSIFIDQVLCSGAQRCMQTWEQLGMTMSCDAPVSYLDALYHSDPPRILSELRNAKGKSVLLLAHNPGVAHMARKLADQPINKPDFARYPTAATSVFSIQIDQWQMLDFGQAMLRDFVTPRMLLT